MNNEQRTIRGFTLIELLVAVGILAIVLSFAGVIFRVSIDSYRTALANAEIMQKLRAITDQLNSDFKGLRKDGEIFVVWTTSLKAGANPNDPNAYKRFDRIMFFADGDFQSYRANPMVRGNLARISYMLAKRGNVRAPQQAPEKRILARTQHIISAIPDHGLLSIGSLTPANLDRWHNIYEYDTIFLEGWKNIPWWPDKAEILTAVTDVKADSRVGDAYLIGATVDPSDPNSIHMLLCEGVGEFKVQGWFDAQQRWVPELDPDGDGDLTDDSDFFIAGSVPDPIQVPGVLYPYPYGGVVINNIIYPQQFVDEAHFYEIPGLGRAFKFTFTLYDSKGVIKNGRTFTHIVYLD